MMGLIFNRQISLQVILGTIAILFLAIGPAASQAPDWSLKPEESGKPIITGEPDWEGKPDWAGRPDWAQKPDSELIGRPVWAQEPEDPLSLGGGNRAGEAKVLGGRGAAVRTGRGHGRRR